MIRSCAASDDVPLSEEPDNTEVGESGLGACADADFDPRDGVEGVLAPAGGWRGISLTDADLAVPVTLLAALSTASLAGLGARPLADEGLGLAGDSDELAPP
eukprot:tig00000383_g24656.t1